LLIPNVNLRSRRGKHEFLTVMIDGAAIEVRIAITTNNHLKLFLPFKTAIGSDAPPLVGCQIFTNLSSPTETTLLDMVSKHTPRTNP
jgi:hypothetical protein